jgi:hypothetical protein
MAACRQWRNERNKIIGSSMAKKSMKIMAKMKMKMKEKQ